MQRSLIAAAIGLAILAGPARAADQPKDLVEYRQAVMSALGGHAGAIARIVKRQVGYDHVVAHAEAIFATAPVTDDIFPEGSGPGDYEKTDALAKIWEQPAEFQERVDTFKQEASDFLAAARTGEDDKILAAFKELGQSCGGCHDNFRAED